MSTPTISPEEMRALAFATAMLAAPPAPAVPGILYRHFDSGGQLLYVGVTDAVVDKARQLAHGRTARWWSFVDRIERQQMADRRTAALAEPRVIAAERPIFNRTAHNGRDQAAREAAYLASAGLPQQVVPVSRRRPRYPVVDLGEYMVQR